MPFFEIVAEEQKFAESKNAGRTSASDRTDTHTADGHVFMNVTDDAEDLPFE